MKKKDIAFMLGLGLFAGYLMKDCSYFRYTPKQEYKQEFKTNLKTFSEKLERKFPKNAKTKNVIPITIYIDPEFKRNHDHWLNPKDNNSWKGILEESLEKATEKFYEEFNICFQIEKVQYWDPNTKRWPPIANFLYQLEEKESKTLGAIGISGKYVFDENGGIAKVEITKRKLNAVIRDIRLSKLDLSSYFYKNIPLENLIQHEISHWLGALDLLSEEKANKKPIGYLYLPDGPKSIMSYESIDETTEWDETNKKRMKKQILLILELQKNLKTQIGYYKPWQIQNPPPKIKKF